MIDINPVGFMIGIEISATIDGAVASCTGTGGSYFTLYPLCLAIGGGGVNRGGFVMFLLGSEELCSTIGYW
jgi:hypothetical protein